MVISKNSQLGLRFIDNQVKLNFMNAIVAPLIKRKELFEKGIETLQNAKLGEDGKIAFEIEEEVAKELGYKIENDTISLTDDEQKMKDVMGHVNEKIGALNLCDDRNPKYFFICDSVYRAAELVKIGDGFTSRALKDIKVGLFIYLMGKTRMVKFECVIGAIKGFYYDEADAIAFEWGLNIDSGEYVAPNQQAKEFSLVMQILTFIELGDIEVIELAGGRNNGKPKNDGKITNTVHNTVYVVDSSWNKLIIRTEGFAVRGHFRLQPCGIDMADRKLIWINAFEKHGYIRRPKAEIVQ